MTLPIYRVYPVAKTNEAHACSCEQLELSHTSRSLSKVAISALPRCLPSNSSSSLQLASPLEKTPPILTLPASLPLQPFQSLNSFWTSQSFPGARLLAHIIGDRFITGTGLEGSQLKFTASALLNLLSILKNHPHLELDQPLKGSIEKIEPMLRQLQAFDESLGEVRESRDYQKLRELAAKWSSEALELKEGESLLLPGGYLGEPGHLMLYRLERETQNTFRFTIYNSGDGAELVANLTSNGVRRKVPYFQRFHKVPHERLKASTVRKGQGFLLLLLEPLFLPLLQGGKKLPKYTGESIYNMIVHHLYEDSCQKSSIEQEHGDFHTPQIANNCGWKGLMALMHDLLPDSRSYKQIVTGLKLYALVAAYQSTHALLSAESLQGRGTCELLHEAARSLTLHGINRASLHTHDGSQANCPSLYLQAQATGLALQQLLQEEIARGDQKRILNRVHSSLVTTDERSKALKLLLGCLRWPTPPEAIPSITTLSAPSLEAFKKLPLLGRLEKLESCLQALILGSHRDHHSACDLLAHLLSEGLLPLPWIDSTEWKDTTADSSIWKASLGLGKKILGHLAGEQIARKQAPSARHSYLVSALFAICDYLACSINPHLKEYPMIDALALRAEDPYEIVLDPFCLSLASKIAPYLAERKGSSQKNSLPLFQLPRKGYEKVGKIDENSTISEIHFLFNHLKKTQIDDPLAMIEQLLGDSFDPRKPTGCLYKDLRLEYFDDLRTSALICQLFTGTIPFAQVGLSSSAPLPTFQFYVRRQRDSLSIQILTPLFLDFPFLNRAQGYPITLRYPDPTPTFDAASKPRDSSFGYSSSHPKSVESLAKWVETPPFFFRHPSSKSSVEAEAYLASTRNEGEVYLLDLIRRSHGDEQIRAYDLLALPMPVMLQLESCELQTLFELALFKTHYLPESGFVSSLAEELSTNQKPLLKHAAHFIKSGVQYSLQQQKHPRIGIALFCIRIVGLIAYMASRSPRPNSQALLEVTAPAQEAFEGLKKQIALNKAPLEQQLQWHLLGVLLAIVGSPDHRGIFTGSSADAACHWLCFNELSSQVEVTKRAVWFEDLVAALYTEQLRGKIFDTREVSQILSRYLEYKQEKLCEGTIQMTRQSDSHSYTLEIGQQKWQLNLTLGAVSSNQGMMKGAQAPSWIAGGLMEKLCGKTPNYYWSGSTLCLEHPSNKRLELCVYDAYADPQKPWYSRLVLKQDGRPLCYLSSDLLTPLVPWSFLADHLFFADPQTGELLAFRRGTLEQVGSLGVEGELKARLVEKEGQEKTYTINRYHPTAAPSLFTLIEKRINAQSKEDQSHKLWREGCDELEQFEQLDYIEQRLSNLSSSSSLSSTPSTHLQLVLPRMSRWQDGRLCSFTERAGQLFYELEPDYFIVPKPLLGHLQNTLTLFNPKRNDYLVLVPLLMNKKVEAPELYPVEMTHFNSFVRLNFPDCCSLDHPFSKIRFFEYHAKGPGQLYGTTAESELWLAALWLAQKDYKRCFETLKRLEISHLDSSHLDRWIGDLFEQFIDFTDQRPCTIGCLVYLASKIVSNLARIDAQQSRNCDEKAVGKLKERIQQLYERYLEIPGYYATYRCPGQLEFALCKFLATGSSMIEARLKQLEGRASAPRFDRGIVQSNEEYLDPGAMRPRFGDPSSFLSCGTTLLMSTDSLANPTKIDGTHLELIQHAISEQEQERSSARALAYQRLCLPKLSSMQKVFLQWVLTLSHPRLSDEVRESLNKRMTPLLTEAKKRGPECAGQVERLLDQVFAPNNTQIRTLPHQYRLSRVHRIESITIDRVSLTPRQRAAPYKLFQPPELPYVQNPAKVALRAAQNGTLTFKLKKQYLSAKQIGSCKLPSFELNDPIIQHAVDQEVEEFFQQLRQGWSRLVERQGQGVNLSFLNQLKEEMSSLAGQLAKDSSDLERRWLSLLNTLPSSALKREIAEAAISGSFQKPIDRRLGALLFLGSVRHAYEKANPHLSSEQIDQGHQLAMEWLTATTELEHLERCLASIDACLQAGHDCPEALSQALDETLHAERVYKPHEHPMLLVFEHFSKLRLRKSQFILLKKLGEEQRSQDALVQLIMGGGKTSVLATVLGTMTAQSGRLSLFLTPASQLESVKKNLAQSRRSAFDMELRVLDFNRSQLELGFLKKLLEDLQTWICFGYMVVSKPECLQFLDLEFITVFSDLEGASSTSKELLDKANVLAQILEILKERTEVLVDEVDLVLHPLLEVNFPRGKPSQLDPSHVDLMTKIYQILVSPHCYLKNDPTQPTLEQWLGLLANEQEKNFSIKRYLEEALPAIAHLLAHRWKETLKLESGPQNYLQSFVDYCSCTLDSENRSKLDPDRHKKLIEYTLRIQQLADSQDPNDRKAVELTECAKEILRWILPVTLSSGGQRKYGRRRDKLDGKVVPFVAAGTPATTDFGSHLEALAYHMQTALQFGVEPSQVRHLAEKLLFRAREQALKGNCLIKQTPLAATFHRLFGIDLEQAQESESLQKAVEKLDAERKQGHYDTLLLTEADSAIACQSYYPSRVSSNAHNLKGMFSSFQAFSGTLWNRHTYPLSLQNHFTPDEGSEGQIFLTLLQKEQTSVWPVVHLVDKLTDLSELLRKTLENHPAIARFEGLMDPAGVFKEIGNRQIAEVLKRWVIDHREHYREVKGILYFQGKESERSGTGSSGDLLTLLTLDSNRPQELSGTSREALQRYGLEPGHYLVYYDERHTTGTDIAQTPSAMNLMTYDETLSTRSMAQSVMRLRQFLSQQSVEIVLSKETACKVAPSLDKVSLQELIGHTLLVQARQKVKISSRGFKQMIDAEFHQFARQHLIQLLLRGLDKTPQGLERNRNLLVSTYKNLKRFLIQEQEDASLKSCGSLEREVPTKEQLQRRIEGHLKSLEGFLQASASQDFLEKIEQLKKKVQEVAGEAEKCSFLSSTELDRDLPTGVELEVELEVEQELQQELEQQKELQRELEQYNLPSNPRARNEGLWSEEQIVELIAYAESNDLRKGYPQKGYNPPHEIPHKGAIPFAQFIEQQVKGGRLKKGLSGFFSDEVLATFHFLHPYDQPVSILHPLFFRPENLLVVKAGEKGFRMICLSRKEAGTLKEWMHKSGRGNLWLINCQGGLIAGDDGQPLSSSCLQKLLIQVQAFLGRIDLLEKDRDSLAAWLEKESEPKLQLLKLRTVLLNELGQLQHFMAHPMLNPLSHNQSTAFLIEHRAADPNSSLSTDQLQKLSKKELCERLEQIPDEAAFITPSQARQLPHHLIGYLKTPEQLAALNEEQIQWITSKQVPLLRSASQIKALGARKSLVERLDGEQLLEIGDEQVPLLNPGQVSKLKKLDHLKLLKPFQLPDIAIKELSSQDIEELLTHLRPSLDSVEELARLSDSEKLQLNLCIRLLIERWCHRACPSTLTQQQLQEVRTEELSSSTTDLVCKQARRNLLAQLSDEQLSALHDPKLLQEVAHERLDKVIQPYQVAHLSDLQLNLLTAPELIQAIPQERLDKVVQLHQIAQLSSQQVAQLSSPLSGLSPQQLLLLRPEAFQQISADQRKSLEPLSSQLQPSQQKYLLSGQRILDTHENLKHESKEIESSSEPQGTREPVACISTQQTEVAKSIQKLSELPSSDLPKPPRAQDPSQVPPTASAQELPHDPLSPLDDRAFAQLPLSRKLDLGYEQLIRRSPEHFGQNEQELNELVKRYPVLINHLLPTQITQVTDPTVLTFIKQELSNSLHPDLLQRLSFARQWRLELSAQRKLPAWNKLKLSLSYLLLGLFHGTNCLLLSALLLPFIWLQAARQKIARQWSAASKITYALRLWL